MIKIMILILLLLLLLLLLLYCAYHCQTLETIPTVSHLVSLKTLGARHFYYFHFTDEEMEAEKQVVGPEFESK